MNFSFKDGQGVHWIRPQGGGATDNNEDDGLWGGAIVDPRATAGVFWDIS